MWKKIVSAVLFLYVGVRTVISFLGDIDFVIERAGDAGWLVPFANFLLNPPGEFLLGAAGLGFVILLWSLWPRQRHKQPFSGQRISARTAHQYLAFESEWGWRTWVRLRGMWDAVFLIGMRRFREASKQNVVHLRGRQWDAQKHENIDPDLWSRIRIREASILDTTNNPGETEQADTSYPAPLHFKDLSVDANQVYEAWPPASGAYRARMRGMLCLIKAWWLVLWPVEHIVERWKRWHAANT